MPLVSVITATYHRPAVLALALDTALRQTVADLELIVVGDACRDETEEVVRAIADPRIVWFNRAVNAGEQSVPNNDGVARASGRYLAFLNHDDLWWPDHLERGIAAIESAGADMAFGFAVVARTGGELVPVALSSSGRYERHQVVPASTWVMRRQIALDVGPWRPATDLVVAPSADWLWRADRAGCTIVQAPELTSVLLPAGERPGSYAPHVGAIEHEGWHRRLTEDPAGTRGEVLATIAPRIAAQASLPVTVRAGLRRVAQDAVRRAAIRAGLTPWHVVLALRYRGRGRYVAELRRRRGLEDRGRGRGRRRR